MQVANQGITSHFSWYWSQGLVLLHDYHSLSVY